MTRINDHDEHLTNPCSLSLEVSLPGHSSVTLLAQAAGKQHACPAHGTVRCEGKFIYPYSCFTFSPKHRDAAWAGREPWPKLNACRAPPLENTREKAGASEVNHGAQSIGTTPKGGAGPCSLCLSSEGLSQPCWGSSSWLQPAWALGQQQPRSSLTQPSLRHSLCWP